MGKYIEGENRNQIVLFPEAIDDYIEEESVVRVIDTFVETLSMKRLGIKRAFPTTMGAPGYDPRDLLKLYIYGYLNRIRSSRRLEKEAQRNVEVMWLLKKLRPDFRTISDFRKENVKGLKAVYREFNRMSEELGLFGKELISQDGSKFQAVNSKERNFTRNKLDDRIKRLDEKIEKYMEILEKNDEEENQEEIKVKVKEAQERVRKYNELREKVEKTGKSQISLTDPDSKLMQIHGTYLVGYNVQTAVDSKTDMIIAYEVTDQVNDNGLLDEMSREVKEEYGIETMEWLADGGYRDKKDLLKCIENKVIPIVPEGIYVMEEEYKEGEVSEEEREGKSPRDVKKCLENGIIPKCYEGLDMTAEIVEKYEREYQEAETEEHGDFERDIERDLVICPMGEILRKKSKSEGRTRYCNKAACQRCLQKCTKAKYKTVDFREGQKIVNIGRRQKIKYEVRKKKVVLITYRPDKEKYKRRKEMSEHPFGTIKRDFDSSYLLLKGKEKVDGEISLSILAYNMKRAIKEMGVKELIEGIKEVGKDCQKVIKNVNLKIEEIIRERRMEIC